jgi:hypothetical protein
VAAGFVEFSVAFYLLVGRSLLRIDAVIVILVLLAAVPEFGALDTVGHIPFVSMLLVLVLHGPSRLQQLAYPKQAGPVTAAARTGGLYILSFVTVMTMYYGLQKAGTWPGPHLDKGDAHGAAPIRSSALADYPSVSGPQNGAGRGAERTAGQGSSARQ